MEEKINGISETIMPHTEELSIKKRKKKSLHKQKKIHRISTYRPITIIKEHCGIFGYCVETHSEFI